MTLTAMGAAEQRRTPRCRCVTVHKQSIGHDLCAVCTACGVEVVQKQRQRGPAYFFDTLVDLGLPQTETLKQVIRVVAVAQKKRRSCLFW